MAKTKENQSFAYQQFKKILKERNLNEYQVSVGTSGKISTTVLTQWSRGDYNLKLDKLQIIADYLNEPITRFIEKKE